ncbi:uncharacterized protein LOC129780366 [Toxorhynchites rutilus septentrionalis]|uniref:uncharacterized protein LOC129780366 n=1 Tax=Toxorhynchites rutilus septentrionalis TaxID=329112 RepID=UPI00247A1E51|nr:uncharacterized protein LOC129780366 [Toxorhynchites rutilus septentrionalis]
MQSVFGVFIIVIILHIISAHRQRTYDALEKLKEAQNEFNDFREYVNFEVTNAKHNSTETLVRFYSTVLQFKELYLQHAIWKEEETLYQIQSQTLYPSTNLDYTCLDFTRVLVEDNMNVAGVQFTHCILDVDEQIKAELTRVLGEMRHDSEVAMMNALGSLNQTNIIANPDQVIENIQSQLNALKRLPNEITSELTVTIQDFGANLGIIGNAYRACLVQNDNILKASFDNIHTQLVRVCRGRLIQAQ